MTAPQITQFNEFAMRVQSNPPIRFETKSELQRFASPGNIILTAIYQDPRNKYGTIQLNSEVQRDASGRIMPPLMPDKSTYIVYSSDGLALEVELITGDKEMREYCLDELREYQDITGLQYSAAFESIPLDELIKGTIQTGVRVIEAEAGFALRSVVRGQNLTVFRPAEISKPERTLSPTENDIMMTDSSPSSF